MLEKKLEAKQEYIFLDLKFEVAYLDSDTARHKSAPISEAELVYVCLAAAV